MALPWDFQQQTSCQFQGFRLPDRPSRGSAPGPRWGLRPRPPSVPQLQICHYTTGGVSSKKCVSCPYNTLQVYLLTAMQRQATVRKHLI